MQELKGYPISPGYARGWAYLYGTTVPAVPRYHIAPSFAESERLRLQNAFRLSAQDLKRLQEVVEAELGHAEAEIFDAHLRLLNDGGLLDRIFLLIQQEQINAEWATQRTIDEAASALMAPDNPYLRERAVDFHDLGQRLLRHLARHGNTPLANLPADSILVARELVPSDLLEIDRPHLAGIVTEMGGATGHAAILARALGIPAVTGITDATRLISSGLELLIDGVSGSVQMNPSSNDLERFGRLTVKYKSTIGSMAPSDALRHTTRDGVTVKFFANIGRAYEAEAVGRYGLDGVGLFRTEYLFLDEPAAPTYDKHVGALRNVVEQLGDRPVVIRTLDLGGDKLPRFLRPHHEANPTLGLRGLRFSLTSGRALFETQISAILALAADHRDIRILLPMVLGPGDFNAALSIIDSLARRQRLYQRPKVGAMIETPASVLTIDEILNLADFVSVGTNDLTQFMLAADRNTIEVIHDHTVLHPAVLRAIRLVAEAGAKQRKSVCVCGEAAADPNAAALFIGLGIRELSMSPAVSKRVRLGIHALDSQRAEALAKQALECQDAESVRATIHYFTKQNPLGEQGYELAESAASRNAPNVDIGDILRGAIELEYQQMKEFKIVALDKSILAWERAMALFRNEQEFARRNLALYDRGYALLKSIVANCADWPGPAKALADAAILRCEIVATLSMKGG